MSGQLLEPAHAVCGNGAVFVYGREDFAVQRSAGVVQAVDEFVVAWVHFAVRGLGLAKVKSAGCSIHLSCLFPNPPASKRSMQRASQFVAG